MPLDKAFLDKFKQKSTYCRNYKEYINSIINEITNILSCRLRNYDSININPFNYGVKDIASLSIAKEAIQKFQKDCEKIILSLEPRISSIEIMNATIDNEKQELSLEISCVIKENGSKISRKIRI